MASDVKKRLGNAWKFAKRPPWRTIFGGATLVLLLLFVRWVWSPGHYITDGRHDLGQNGIWLQHGWLGADSWFIENGKTERIPLFRNTAKVRGLASLLRRNHFTDVYPHLCPAQANGSIAAVNDGQVELFLREFKGFRVMPWVGGVLGDSALPDDPKWRAGFIKSITTLLEKHPQIAGVHVNIEPCPSGNTDLLVLLADLRKALPKGKILSIAAYPPPTYWHPFPEVHWEEAYFRKVAAHVDQMVVMMYDTALKDGKIYQYVMRSWTQDILAWSARTPVLLGVPAYEDAGTGYHNPEVENIQNSLMGIHAGLNQSQPLPSNYKGVAVYSEWQMDDAKWQSLRTQFLKHSPSTAPSK
jgi:hypothetical protein